MVQLNKADLRGRHNVLNQGPFVRPYADRPQNGPAGNFHTKFKTLISLFPKLDPEFLRFKAREFSQREDEFALWVDATLEYQDGLPSRDEYCLKLKVKAFYFHFQNHPSEFMFF